MEIPIPPFPDYAISCTSRDPVDEENLIFVNLTIGIDLPFEGVVNLNFSVKTNLT